MENLDLKCAELGQRLAARSDVSETLLTDALGVLDEQGLYAAFLYLKARGGDGGQAVNEAANGFLKSLKWSNQPAEQERDVMATTKGLSKDLDDLLLARDLVRQALVYGRYHIKARTQ